MTMPLYFLTADPGLLAHWRFAGLGGLLTGVESLAEVPAGIVLLDATPGVLDAILVKGLQLRHRIVLLSLNPDDAEGFAALSAGCAGYCHALAPVEQLRQVLEVVAAGEIWAGRTLVLRMIAAMQKLPQAGMPDLSALSVREHEVAMHVARGLSNKEVARVLDITERTVKAHLSACFAKLGVGDRIQLVLHIKGQG